MLSQRVRAAMAGVGALLFVTAAGACSRDTEAAEAPDARTRTTQGAEIRTLGDGNSTEAQFRKVQLETGAAVSDAEVAEFSRVQVELLELHAALTERAEAGEDPALLQLELQERAEDLIEGSDLPLERLSEIAQQAQDDPALRGRVEAEVRDRLTN